MVGKRLTRLDGPTRCRGVRHTYDINRPGMLHARILRSPHAHASCRSISEADRRALGSAALAVLEPGKKAMYQGDEAGRGGHRGAGTRRAAPDQGGVRGAAPRRHRRRALQAGAPAVFEGGNIKEGEAEESGDLEAGFKSAAHIVEARTKRRCRRTCLETKGCVRVGGRHAHRMDLDPGRARQPRRTRGGAADPAGQRPHDLRHGRRLRQQVRA